jgi:hypothetical protein
MILPIIKDYILLFFFTVLKNLFYMYSENINLGIKRFYKVNILTYY